MERFRKLSRAPRRLQVGIALLVPLSGLAFILDLPYRLFSVSLFPQQFLGLFLGLVLAYVFVSVPMSGSASRSSVPWYDALLGLAGLCGGFYVSFFYRTLLMELGLVSPWKVVLGLLLITAVLEATRRLVGWPMVAIVLLFALYARYGFLLPGFLASKEIAWPRLINQLYLGSEFLFGTALQTAGLVVLSFVFLGQFLFGTGGAGFFLDVAQGTMGRYRGGPAKVAIVASATFGALSASAVANVAAVGMVTIPLMIRTGYPRHFAGAVEAVSSTGDGIMPPIMGAAAFVMAELLGVPYLEVALAALVPALLFYLGQFIQVDLRAAREGLKGLPKEELPSARSALRKGWVFIVPIVALVYALFVAHLRAEIAAIYGLGALLVVIVLKKERRGALKNAPALLEQVTQGMLEVTAVCAAAGLVIGVISYTGLGLSFARILTTLGREDLFLVAILTAITSLILGMGMPMTASYLFLGVLAAPAMVELGVEPLLAHLFVLYFAAYSFLTPPVGLAAYVAASIAGAPMLKTAWQAMKLAAAGYIVPFILIYKPQMVFRGGSAEVALAILDSILAVVALAIASEGFVRRPLSALTRVLFLVSSLALFIPGWSSRIVGFVLLAALTFRHLRGAAALQKDQAV